MENQDPESAPSGKRSFKKLIILAFLLLLIGGGSAGGFYYWRSSTATAAENDKGKGKKGKSQNAAKEDDSAEGEAAGDEPAEESSDAEHGSSDEDVKHVIELPPFIINLADTEQSRYLRMSVSLGIGEGEETESDKPDPVFNTKVRNAILGVLTSKKSDEILNAQGKAKLRDEILEAARAASSEPHVAAVYITEFIVQL